MISVKQFRDFADWNIDRMLFSRELESHFCMKELSAIIAPRCERVKPFDIPRDRLIVAKIRFSDGEVSFRNRVIKNDMYRSRLHDLLVSNINFEKGAFAVNIWGDIYASTDYTSYVIDSKQILPEYLQLVLRSATFLQYVASVKPKGMKTRARYEFIKRFSIPLPAIPEQTKLLDMYHALLAKTKRFEAEYDNSFSNILTAIQREVSVYREAVPDGIRGSAILSAINFTSTERWEVDYIFKEGRIENIANSFRCPAMSTGDLQRESLFGLSIKASPERKKGMIPILRMANVQNGEIAYDTLKYLPYDCAVTQKEPEKWLLKKGDFLVTRTNGSKELVGKSAVFHSDDTYTYASYLIRYRFDTSVVLPDYVNILFMTPLVREQIAVMRRQGGGQYNLNSDEINAILIPVPDISMQESIIRQYEAALRKAKQSREQAAACVNEANRYVESRLFL